MVRRVIPKYIGNVSIPENRETTEQLLFCWAQLTGEVDNVKPLLRKLKDKMTEKAFVLQAQEVSMYLSQVLEEKKFPKKCNTDIYVGNPSTPTGYFNSRVAGVLHLFFDDPEYKTKKPCIPCSGEVP